MPSLPPASDPLDFTLAPYTRWGLTVLSQQATPMPPPPSKPMVRFLSHAEVPPWNYVNPRMPAPNPPPEAPRPRTERKRWRRSSKTGDDGASVERSSMSMDRQSDGKGKQSQDSSVGNQGSTSMGGSLANIFNTDRVKNSMDGRHSPGSSVDSGSVVALAANGKLDRTGLVESVWWAPLELRAMKLVNIVEWRYELARGGWANAPEEDEMTPCWRCTTSIHPVHGFDDHECQACFRDRERRALPVLKKRNLKRMLEKKLEEEAAAKRAADELDRLLKSPPPREPLLHWLVRWATGGVRLSLWAPILFGDHAAKLEEWERVRRVDSAPEDEEEVQPGLSRSKSRRFSMAIKSRWASIMLPPARRSSMFTQAAGATLTLRESDLLDASNRPVPTDASASVSRRNSGGSASSRRQSRRLSPANLSKLGSADADASEALRRYSLTKATAASAAAAAAAALAAESPSLEPFEASPKKDGNPMSSRGGNEPPMPPLSLSDGVQPLPPSPGGLDLSPAPKQASKEPVAAAHSGEGDAEDARVLRRSAKLRLFGRMAGEKDELVSEEAVGTSNGAEGDFSTAKLGRGSTLDRPPESTKPRANRKKGGDNGSKF